MLSGVRPEHRAFTEEIFGPVAPVLRFGSVDEAIDLVNASEYGLSVRVLSRDAFGRSKLGDRINSGVAAHQRRDRWTTRRPPRSAAPAPPGPARGFGGHEANIEAFTETQLGHRAVPDPALPVLRRRATDDDVREGALDCCAPTA